MIRPTNMNTSIASNSISALNKVSEVSGLLSKIRAEYGAKCTYTTRLEDYATYLEGKLLSAKKAAASDPASAPFTTARQWLDALDAFFTIKAQPSYPTKSEQHKLWDVLTALRGPDSQDSRTLIKAATTEVIRLHAFPNAAATNAIYGDFGADTESRVERRSKMPSVGDHFKGHALVAFKVLGLVWDRLNSTTAAKPEPVPPPLSSFGNGNNDQFTT